MMRLFAYLPLLAAALLAQSVSIQFKSVDRTILSNRLSQVSTNNAERAQRLLQMFREAGCTGDRLREQQVKGSKVPNVICTHPGQSEDMIVVGARLDWWGSAGQGVVDNWSGAVLLPTLYQSLPDGPRRHTFVFVGFSDRESSAEGSRQFVRQLSREQRERVRAMIQLTSLGTAPARVWMKQSDPKLINDLARVAAAMKVPVTGVNIEEEIPKDDAAAFRDVKIPTLSMYSLTAETAPVLGTARDTVEAIRPGDYYDTYRLLAAYLMLLDATLSPPAQ
ncbi:MAG: M28 family metallopeptidase [Bryobacteraceae bacterium]